MPNSVGQQQSMGTVPASDVGDGDDGGEEVEELAWLYIHVQTTDCMWRWAELSQRQYPFFFFVIGFAMRHLEVPYVAEDVRESEDAHTSSDSTWGPVGGARGEQWLERVTQRPPTPLESQLQLVKGSKL